MHTVESAKSGAVNAMNYFLRNFSHVPDDKLNWSPTPTSKTPLRIAAHTALYASRFAWMIRERTSVDPDKVDEWWAKVNAEELALTDREEVVKVFRAGTDEILAALDSLKPEELDMVIQSGEGWSLTMQDLMGFPRFHAIVHAGQIDYLQTCWDDQKIYVG